jgi:hypothetical protein
VTLPLPSDINAERAVLGSVLLDRDAIVAAKALCAVDDFELDKHQLIYSAMLDCLEERIPPDVVTISAKLKDKNQYDQCAGGSYLWELMDCVPTALHVEHYAKVVAETAAKRRIIQLGAEISARAYNGGKIEEIMRDVGAMIEVNHQAAAVSRAGWTKHVQPASTIYQKKFGPTNYIIDQIVPEGTMIITGKPKTRKSWLALNLCLAVAYGGKALGYYQAQRGDALYIDLEMGEKRIHRRLHVASPDAIPPRGLQFATLWPTVDRGFEEWFVDYMDTHPYTKLIVIDTLVAVRPPRNRNEEPYESDKRFTQKLTDLSHRYGIAMVMIHHSRKADGSDVTDDASGSTGLVGGVDNFGSLRLSRHEEGAGTLSVVGRDIEFDGEINLRWDTRLAQWNRTEEAVSISPERRAILELLEEQGGLKSREVALILRRDEDGTRRILSEMKSAGLVMNEAGKWYAGMQNARTV